MAGVGCDGLAGEGRPFLAEAWRLREVRHEVCGEDLAISGFGS